MPKEPKVYIAMQDGDRQLVVDGPLELFERLVATLRENAPKDAGRGFVANVREATTEVDHADTPHA